MLKIQFGVERRDNEDLLKVAIIWRVPLLDPARWEAIVKTLWRTRVITLALRMTLVSVGHADGGR